MVSLNLDKRVERRLQRLSRKAGVSAELCAEQALTEFLDDLNAAEIALLRLRKGGKWHSSEEMRRAVGL